MPADIRNSDSQQHQSPEIMSTPSPKSFGDATHTTSTFSYAQAAKGRSPSMPSSLSAGKALSDTMETNAKGASTFENKSEAADPSTSATKGTVSEGRSPQGDRFQSVGGRQPSQLDVNGISKIDSSIPPDTTTLSGPISSYHSSPDFGTTSSSTLPKEDDMLSAVNGSSDATSDKQSQTSQSGTKGSDRNDNEKEQNVSGSWDEEASLPASLKEAPPPPVNFWEQRREAQEAEAKAKAKQSVHSQQPKSANSTNATANTNGVAKGTETVDEPKRQDGKKKGKTGLGSPENRPASGLGKEIKKAADVAVGSTSIMNAPPPPPGDAISWPTPDSTLGEIKRKPQDRVEKGDKGTSQAPKSHGKEKWVHVPYVPTAVFNTPLPPARRGGRAPRGGRETFTRGGNSAGGSNGSERSAPGHIGTAYGHMPSAGGIDRGKGGSTSTTNSNVPKSKRASSAGPVSVKEQRKSGDAAFSEKKEADQGTSQPNEDNVGEIRRSSATASTSGAYLDRSPAGASSHEANDYLNKSRRNYNGEDKKYHNATADAQVHPRIAEPERRSDGSTKPPDHAKDFHGNLPSRERGEGRQDRGRGGYRGRGGGNHSYFNSNAPSGHNVSNGHASQYQTSTGPPFKSNTNHERLSSQPPGSAYPAPPHQGRTYRSNSRSQSIAHPAPYGRFNGPHTGAPHLANLHTDLANEYSYQPGGQGIMSATPYHPMMEPISMFAMMSLQMDYYFSVDNLCKDMYLRRHMDSQGFVLLSVLADFRRIKLLTTDLEMIRYVCLHSPNIDIPPTADGIARVRRLEGWQQWVLRMEDRDPSAQNEGPELQNAQYSQVSETSPTVEDRQEVSPRPYALTSTIDSYQYPSLGTVPPPAFGQAAPIASPTTNPADNCIQTPLSAAVSDFSPAIRPANNGGLPTSDGHSHIFTDQQVENLNILVRKPMSTAIASASMRPTLNASSSRTFSNGSIDGRSINDELNKFVEHPPISTGSGDAPER